MNVLVFRTNIDSDARVHRAVCRLCWLRGRSAGAVGGWSLDLEDADRVLRIETQTLTESDVCRALQRVGPTGEGLTD